MLCEHPNLIMDGNTMDDFSVSMVMSHECGSIVKALNAVTAIRCRCRRRSFLASITFVYIVDDIACALNMFFSQCTKQSLAIGALISLFSSHFRFQQQYNWQFHTIKYICICVLVCVCVRVDYYHFDIMPISAKTKPKSWVSIELIHMIYSY